MLFFVWGTHTHTFPFRGCELLATVLSFHQPFILSVNLCEIVAGITSGKNPRGTVFPLPVTVPSFYCSSGCRGDGDGGVWVQLNPGSAGHVAHEVPQHEDLMLANGLKRLSVNVAGLLGGHVCQAGYKLNWC